MAAAGISELDPSKDAAAAAVVEEIVRLERKIFPKHESLSKSFHDELRKKNSGVMYLKTNKGKEGEEEIVGYAMYSWISSLCASITKLAGYVCFDLSSPIRLVNCGNRMNSLTCLMPCVKQCYKVPHIVLIAVKESHRRQGHGEALLKAAIQRCRTRKIQRICLHVDPTRIAALSLYRKLGFQIDELIRHYYSPGRNAYRMYLEFDE
ncbi:unnamed protein product [Musa acuminata var. zebrina]